MHAIIDGYFREAITTFASALGRFCEACIDILLIARSIAKEGRGGTWKQVNGASERQFGAFIYLHQALIGSSAPTLPKSMIELRNQVVHKGKIPARVDAVNFGGQVQQILKAVIATMHLNFQEAIDTRNFERIREMQQVTGNEQTRRWGCFFISMWGQVSK